jgi:hypothetical protein
MAAMSALVGVQGEADGLDAGTWLVSHRLDVIRSTER